MAKFLVKAQLGNCFQRCYYDKCVMELKEIMKITGAEKGDSIFFACGFQSEVERIFIAC